MVKVMKNAFDFRLEMIKTSKKYGISETETEVDPIVWTLFLTFKV